MNKIFHLFFLVLFVAPSAFSQEPIEEVVITPPVKESPGFNAPELIPIQVYLCQDQKILIVPRMPLGAATVCLENLATGSSDNHVLILDEATIIPAPSNSGRYRILLTLQNGRSYHGEFEMN